MSNHVATIDEKQIVQGCIHNDRKSQETLYKHYYKPMLGLCFRYTKNQEDAIEVFHEGLLKIFQNAQNFDASKSALFTWIHTIMVRTAIDFLRKKNLQIVNVEWTENTEPVITADVFAESSAEDIIYILKQLPQVTASVFNLHVIEGYKHKEIAELLNMTEGTSKWHLSEAKKRLTLLLTKEKRA